jgi:phospholipid:diacylglycerol acyltransferase
MPHEPERFNPRGGPNTADHVDILGRSSLNDLILRVAGGKGERIEETIFSKIKEYSAKVRIPFEDDEDEENIDPATTMDDDDAHSILSNVKAFMGEVSAQRQASVEAAREFLKRKGIQAGGALEHAKDFVKETGEHARDFVKEKGEEFIHEAREKIHEAKEKVHEAREAL